MNGVNGHYHLRGIESGHVLGQVVLVLTEQSENISSHIVVHDKILEGGREGEEGGRREEGGGRVGGREGGERGRGREKDLKDRKQKEERRRGMHTHTL